MARTLSRRSFIQSSMSMAAASLALEPARSFAEAAAPSGKLSPIPIGLGSYTFRNFSRAQLIGFLKQLNVSDLNVKDVKDHLPMDPAAEAQAVADYAAAGIKLQAASISFANADENDIRGKFECCKRAGIGVIVAGDATLETIKRIEKFVEEYDLRIAIHFHGAADKEFPSLSDLLKVINDLDPRIGCAFGESRKGLNGARLIEAIHTAGPRLNNITIKDLTRKELNAPGVAGGGNTVPVREIFEALLVIKYQGFVDLVYEIDADDPMPGVIVCISYLRGVLTGMGYLSQA